jgi:hypothetical protein
MPDMFARAAGSMLFVCLIVGGCECDTTPPITGRRPPGVIVDVFAQETVARVDVLWVIDNSGSMTEEQDSIGREFDNFLQFLTAAEVDYHIAVITTDTQAVPLYRGDPPYIAADTPDPQAEFAARAKVGVGGAALEKGLEAARLALQRPPDGFLRDDAFLFIVWVSDEEDHSFGDVRYYWRLFEQSKGIGNDKTVTGAAIVGDVPGGCDSENGAASPGARYHELVASMGGLAGSICAPSFAATLTEMGIAAAGLRRKFTLSQTPDLKTLEVLFRYPCSAPEAQLGGCEVAQRSCSDTSNPKEIRCEPAQAEKDGWSYEETTNSILFDGKAIPGKGSIIEIAYLKPKPVPQ